MTAIAPSSPLASPTPVGSGPLAAAAPAGITNLPPGLANLTAGAILNGAVVGRDGQGHVLVQTPNGMLSLATALPLPQGSTLSLQVQTMGAQIQMVVLSINQQPQQPGARNVVTVATPPPSNAASPAAPVPLADEPAVTVTTGRVFTATVVESNPPVNVPASPDSPPPPALPARVSAAMLDAQPVLATLLGRPPREAGDTTLQKGSRLTVSIATFDTDPASDAKALMKTAAEMRPGARLIPGIVVEPDASGMPQLATPIGTLSLSTKIPLPPEARVILEAVGDVELPPPVQDDGDAPSVAQGRGWPALDDALAALSRDDPAVSKRTTEQVLPKAGADMAPALVAAVTALKTGDVRALLGDHLLKALDLAGHHDIAVRLAADFQQLTGVIADPSGGDWRSYLIPVHDGANVQFLRFLVRRKRRNAARVDEGDSTTRFIVEVDMSRLGALQLDGLVKPKKFDLIIRSRKALEPGMRRDIAKVFNDSLAASGHRGALSFQAGANFAPLPKRGGAPVGLSV